LLQARMDSVNEDRKKVAMEFATIGRNASPDSVAMYSAQLKLLNQKSESFRNRFREISKKSGATDTNDTNYIFLSFVRDYMPFGLKGLLIAVIFLAAWGSIAAALNSLASSTVIDFHRRIGGPKKAEHEYKVSKWYTLAWGVFSIIIAQFAHRLGQSLIETVNILGSLFYGVILGIFLVAFYMKKIRGNAVFIAALIVEAFIIILFFNEYIPGFSFLPDVSFLWLNVIGALGVAVLAWAIQLFTRSELH
jgi:solute:Na+ symporter, SSS family